MTGAGLRERRVTATEVAADGCYVGLVSDAESHLSPGSRMEVVEDAGHFLHLERPETVNERILAWVRA